MEPLTPISEPTVVRSELSSMRPSATRANPEYALRTVMTTANYHNVSKVLKIPSRILHLRISAPPMAAVVVYPFKKLRTAFPVKQAAAIAGEPGAIIRKVPIVAMFAPRREPFTRCLPGSTRGLDDIFPASLKNATIEPVKVMPPIRTPRYAVTICSTERWLTSAITLPILVSTAASPTTECNAATIWGSSMAVIRRPIESPKNNNQFFLFLLCRASRYLPIVLPIPATAAN